MRKYNKKCEVCGGLMRRHGVTSAGRERYFCPRCKKATTIRRDDTRLRHEKDRLIEWLTGVDDKDAIAKKYGVTRRALSKEFRKFFSENPNGMAPIGFAAKRLIVDAKFIHGSLLCALIAVTEEDKIFWQFADDVRSSSSIASTTGNNNPVDTISPTPKAIQAPSAVNSDISASEIDPLKTEKERIKAEIERHKKFQSGLLGIKGQSAKVGDIDVRNYAKYILRDGMIFEKRELLTCLRSKITMALSRKSSLEPSR